MQVDQALYLQTSHAKQEAILTEHQLGNTCSRRLMNNIRKSLSSNHRDDLQQFFADAIKNEWLLVLVIDDYTTIHTIRRPTQTKFSQANNMCTIIVKAFKEIPAIRRPNDITLLHDPNGMNIEALLATITSPVQMSMLGNSYAATLPNWITDDFFNPESQLDRLRDHQYCEGHLVRDMRKMDNVHLVNFVELTLKGKNAFETAYDIAMATDLKSYAKKFVVIQPGDWPCQFYCRQVVYQQTYNVQKKKTFKTAAKKANPLSAKPIPSINIPDHEYCFNIPHSTTVAEQQTTSLLQPNSPFSYFAPMMGPLYISLNSKEHVFLTFWPFFQRCHENLFPNCKLPEKPRPWRINLLLELVYGGWLLVRSTTLKTFSKSKDLQYGTLLNLLDNYIPLVLSICSVTFKSNNFNEYFNAMIRIWVMFVCLKCHHYNKSIIVWLSMINHWGRHFPKLHNVMKQWQIIGDEYPVENAHSIICSQTLDSDTAETLSSKVKAIFQSKEKQKNFLPLLLR